LKRGYLILGLCGACVLPVPALADLINFTGSVQSFTAATTGVYDIVAFGASGGNRPMTSSAGLGAEIGGDFYLTAGEVLDVYVGGAGKDGTLESVSSANQGPLVISGGGGVVAAPSWSWT